jgi:hypothetical protein
MRTLVTFKSDAFNTSETKDYFINPQCFGDDVAKWLIQELSARGFQADSEPHQEDFGWYLTFRAGGAQHDLVIGFRPSDASSDRCWIGWLERKRGFLGSLLGGRNRGVQAAAVGAIHEILSRSPEIREVRWHLRTEFDRGNAASALDGPDALPPRN